MNSQYHQGPSLSLPTSAPKYLPVRASNIYHVLTGDSGQGVKMKPEGSYSYLSREAESSFWLFDF